MTDRFLFTNNRKYLLLIAGILFFSSCKKEPGEGGLATIRGKVFSYTLSVGYVVDSSYLAGERVYISYGDNTWVDDDTRTSYNGEFAFEWLQPGDYKVWVLSNCDVCPEERRKDVIEVKIDKRKETVEVRDLIHYKD